MHFTGSLLGFEKNEVSLKRGVGVMVEDFELLIEELNLKDGIDAKAASRLLCLFCGTIVFSVASAFEIGISSGFGSGFGGSSGAVCAIFFGGMLASDAKKGGGHSERLSPLHSKL